MTKLYLGIQRLFGPDADFDFFRLWETHVIPPELDPLIDRFARVAFGVFNWEGRPWHDIGEWVKKNECWEQMKASSFEFSEEEIRFLKSWTVLRIPEFGGRKTERDAFVPQDDALGHIGILLR